MKWGGNGGFFLQIIAKMRAPFNGWFAGGRRPVVMKESYEKCPSCKDRSDSCAHFPSSSPNQQVVQVLMMCQVMDCRISSQARRREKQTLSKTFASQQFLKEIVTLGLNLSMQTNRQYVLLCISVRRLRPRKDRLREWHAIVGGEGRVRKGEADQGDVASAKGTM